MASFTATVEAAERALAAGLPIASSQRQAEQLLQETAEAQSAKLSLKGILDLRGPLDAALRDHVLQPAHLDGVASSLEVSCIAAVSAHRLSNHVRTCGSFHLTLTCLLGRDACSHRVAVMPCHWPCLHHHGNPCSLSSCIRQHISVSFVTPKSCCL